MTTLSVNGAICTHLGFAAAGVPNYQTSVLVSELSERQWLPFAINVWAPAIALAILVVRLMLGRPLLSRRPDRKVGGRHS